MMQIINFIAHPITQAVFWSACVLFAIYFAYAVKNMSFGKDAGTKSWYIIMTGLFLIGFRVSFKVIFVDYKMSYGMQILRYAIGLAGIIVLFYGFNKFSSSIKKLYGREN